jgi:hypothetical protein
MTRESVGQTAVEALSLWGVLVRGGVATGVGRHFAESRLPWQIGPKYTAHQVFLSQ